MAIGLALAAVKVAEILTTAEAVGEITMDLWENVHNTIGSIKQMAADGRTELTDEEWAETTAHAHRALDRLKAAAGDPGAGDGGTE